MECYLIFVKVYMKIYFKIIVCSFMYMTYYDIYTYRHGKVLKDVYQIISLIYFESNEVMDNTDK